MAQRRLRAKGWEVRWEAVEARRAEQARAGGEVPPPPPEAVRDDGGAAGEGAWGWGSAARVTQLKRRGCGCGGGGLSRGKHIGWLAAWRRKPSQEQDRS